MQLYISMTSFKTVSIIWCVSMFLLASSFTISYALVLIHNNNRLKTTCLSLCLQLLTKG